LGVGIGGVFALLVCLGSDFVQNDGDWGEDEEEEGCGEEELEGVGKWCSNREQGCPELFGV